MKTITRMKLALTFIGLTTAFAHLTAAASTAKVIANTSVLVSEISSDDLRGILLATRTVLADGGHVEPVLLKSGSVHDAFVKRFTGKTAAGLENYYRSLIFTGKGLMPRMLGSDAEMVAYVRATKGAIGYVSADASTAGVKVLEVR